MPYYPFLPKEPWEPFQFSLPTHPASAPPKTMSPPLRQPGVFGQLNWDTYTLVLLGFPLAPSTDPDQVLSTLDKSALHILEKFPFLAGQVVKRGQSSTNSGTYEIIPYAPHDGKSPVRSKDCTQLCPSYEEILKAEAPFSMLDGDVLCPMKGMGYAYDESVTRPVFIVQANFIKGGVILCFASMHNGLDMNGQGTLMKMFAAVGRGESIDPKMVEEGNRDADSIVPPLKEGEEVLEHKSMRRPSMLGMKAGHGSGGKAPWVYWGFSKESLEALKKEASTGESWVSTNDAITAFFMQRLTAVRIAAGRVDPNEDIHCFRAVDLRRVLNPPIHEGFLGHLAGLADTVWPTASSLATSSLASASLALRASLKEVDDHYARSLATLIRTTEDKTTIFYAAEKKGGKDALVSSWAQLAWLSSTDFGPGLGKPDFVRRARLPDLPDLSYIMPKDRKGRMALGASMFEEDFEGLKGDEVWSKYVKVIG